MPREVDSVIDILTGDAESLRRLIERATRRTAAQDTAANPDPTTRDMLADVRGLGDELRRHVRLSPAHRSMLGPG